MKPPRTAYKELAHKVDYDPETGRVRWKTWPSIVSARFAGLEAGTIHDNGYRRVVVHHGGRRHPIYIHRLVWFLSCGKIPAAEIDHINGDRLDNRIENLRETTRGENARNMSLRSDNGSGVSGVSLCKVTGRWKARVAVGGRVHWLGRFDSLQEAERVVQEFRRLHGFSARHGTPNENNAAS